MKLAFVVQRYGAAIAGGSEAHCRLLAERLAPRHDITVLTTCAQDYVSWENALPAGTSRIGSVTVVRFPVRRPRRLQAFADLSDEVFAGRSAPARQHEWFRENGPDAPGILDHLRRHGRDYDLVLFWTFRYAPSYFGLPLVADRAILVPTAEDDPAIRLDVLEPFLQLPAGFLFLTHEEQALVTCAAGRELQPSAVVGIGLDRGPTRPEATEVLNRHGLPRDYILYLGRVDRNKGCHTLLHYFREFASQDRFPLLLAGPATMPVPEHPRIRALGYVAEDLRQALLAQARVLVVPSRYESLSIVLLEGWNHGIPALVNGQCRVLEGQVRRANGGLMYRSQAEFCDALGYLLSHDAERAAFGRQGLAFVDREYRWPTVLDRVERLLDAVRERTGRAARPAASHRLDQHGHADAHAHAQ